MNRGGFSWSRFFGMSSAKASISRKTGVPFTKSGRERKAGRALTKGSGGLLNLITTLFFD